MLLPGIHVALADAAKQRNRPMFLEPAISANYKLQATRRLVAVNTKLQPQASNARGRLP